MPMVFSSAEREHIRALPDQAEAFCASFCCKEATLKALGRPFQFTSCELYYQPGHALQRPVISASDRTLAHILDSTVRFFQPFSGEMVAVVHLFGRRK